MPSKKVISLQPMWRPDFSFYLLPPADWLRHYYGIPAQSPLLPHYLLHPLKLLVHYLVEILRAVLRGPELDTETAVINAAD